MAKNLKINPQELEAFRAALPETERHEQFDWLRNTYDVVIARFIIQQQSLATKKVNVKAWAEAFGMSGPENQDKLSFNILTGVSDEKALADHINPTIPIIIIEHVFKSGRKNQSSHIILDGNHRLRKAFLKGLPDIEAYYLPKELSKLTKLR